MFTRFEYELIHPHLCFLISKLGVCLVDNPWVSRSYVLLFTGTVDLCFSIS